MPLLRSARSGPDANGYYCVGSATDLDHQQMRSTDVGGEIVIVTRLDQEYFAFSATCPHAAGDLRKGEIYRGRIDCPDHDYRFDVRSGRSLWPPDEVCRLKHFEVVVREDQLFIRPITPAGR